MGRTRDIQSLILFISELMIASMPYSLLGQLDSRMWARRGGHTLAPITSRYSLELRSDRASVLSGQRKRGFQRGAESVHQLLVCT